MEPHLGSSIPDIRSSLSRGRWVIAACAAAAVYAGCKDDLTGPPQTAVASALTPASPSPITGTAGQPVTQRPAVLVVDQRGDPMFGVEVTFAVASGGGSLAGATVFTDAQGIARVGSWTLGTATGANTLTATAGSLSPVIFTATAQPGAPANLTKTAGDEQTVNVATAVPIAPAVAVRDAFDNPISGVGVTFAVTSGGGSVTGATVTTNNAGVATVGSWTLGTGPGANTLTATFDALTVTFTATGVVGAPASMTKEAGDNQTAVAATAVTTAPAVRITDVHGNPVAGVTVTFAIAAGGGSVTGATAVTNANGGAAVGSWTLGTIAGENTLNATAGALSATFAATGTPAPAANIAKHAGDAQTATVATAVGVSPAVRVTDIHANPVSGVAVMFTVTAGGGSVTGGAQITDANGVAVVGSWTLGATAGANALTASAGALDVSFMATGIAGAPASIAKHAGDAQSAIAGTPVTVAPAVRITDAHWNPVPGVSVEFAVASGGGSVTGALQATNGNGVAAVGSWTLGTIAGANSLTATAGALTTTFLATGTADAPAHIVKVAGDAQNATVGTAVAIAPAVHVTDQFGNDVSNVTVTFAVSGGGGSVAGATQSTDMNGAAAVGSWTLGTTVGVNELTASVGSLAVVFAATGTPGAPANIVIVTGGGQSATVNTAVAVAPTVRVTDMHGNAVPDVTVTFAVESGSGSTTGAAPSTDSDGNATLGSWTLGTSAGDNTLRASVNGVSVLFTATGTADLPTTMTKHAGDDQTATVNTAVAIDPAVLITDQFGNPVSGVSVTFAVVTGGGFVSGAVQSTGADGIAAVDSWMLGTIASSNTMSATAGALTVTFSAAGTAGPVAGIIKVAGDNQSAPAGSELPISPAVRLVDSFGNNVEGVAVTFSVTSGGGSVTDEEQSTGANGVATVGSWTLGDVPGPNSLTGSGGGLTAVFNATGTP
jgi:adhesin/invasin